MEIPVSAQALTFAQGALLGLGLCLAYDLLRALRQLCPRTGLAADALFGLLLTASFLSFGTGAVPAVCVPRRISDRRSVFPDAQPAYAARVPGTFPSAGADFADAVRACALFFEISQKNFKNPLCKLPKMGYNDL